MHTCSSIIIEICAFFLRRESQQSFEYIKIALSVDVRRIQ